MKRVEIKIEGMTCKNCENHVKDEFKKLGAKKIKVSAKESNAIFDISNLIKNEDLKKAVLKAGYKPENIILCENRKKKFSDLFK